jgi:predicted dehydrogenase
MPTADGKIIASVIGAGWYAAQNHIPVLAAREDVVLDGVCRLGQADLKRVKEHFGFAFASEDHRDVLERKPDVVVVGSPHHLHFRHALDAIEAGAHVMCEKPMTLEPAEAYRLVAAAKDEGVELLLANSYHYVPHLEEVRNIVRGGSLGAVEHVACSFISATRPVFEGAVGFKRWQTSFFRPDRSTWQSPAQGGGFAYGQMSHAIPLTLWMTGLEPREIAGHVLTKAGIDICDSGSLVCDNGAVVSLSGSPAMPEGRRALMRLHIAGSDGLLIAEFDRDRCDVFWNDGSERHFEYADGTWSPYAPGPPNALVDLAKGSGQNLSPGLIGAQTVAVIHALLESAADGGAAKPVYRPTDTEGARR